MEIYVKNYLGLGGQIDFSFFHVLEIIDTVANNCNFLTINVATWTYVAEFNIWVEKRINFKKISQPMDEALKEGSFFLAG